MQGDRRAAPETLRHALVPARRDRHPDPALPASQRPLGRDLAAAAQPGRSGLNPRLTAARTQTIEVSQVTRESPTNLSHTRSPPKHRALSAPPDSMARRPQTREGCPSTRENSAQVADRLVDRGAREHNLKDVSLD